MRARGNVQLITPLKTNETYNFPGALKRIIALILVTSLQDRYHLCQAGEELRLIEIKNDA